MFENIKEDKFKQMRSSWQNDKLEQWVMHREVREDVLGSILGCKKQTGFFPCVIVSNLQLKHSYQFNH